MASHVFVSAFQFTILPLTYICVVRTLTCSASGFIIINLNSPRSNSIGPSSTCEWLVLKHPNMAASEISTHYVIRALQD